jgi:hypothetical protein
MDVDITDLKEQVILDRTRAKSERLDHLYAWANENNALPVGHSWDSLCIRRLGDRDHVCWESCTEHRGCFAVPTDHAEMWITNERAVLVAHEYGKPHNIATKIDNFFKSLDGDGLCCINGDYKITEAVGEQKSWYTEDTTLVCYYGTPVSINNDWIGYDRGYWSEQSMGSYPGRVESIKWVAEKIISADGFIDSEPSYTPGEFTKVSTSEAPMGMGVFSGHESNIGEGRPCMEELIGAIFAAYNLLVSMPESELPEPWEDKGWME